MYFIYNYHLIIEYGVGIVLDSRTVPNSGGKTNWIVAFSLGGHNNFRKELNENELNEAIIIQKAWENQAFSNHVLNKDEGVDNNYF